MPPEDAGEARAWRDAIERISVALGRVLFPPRSPRGSSGGAR
jgi:hypothetical protein